MHAVSAIQGDRTGTPSFLYFPFCFQVTDGVAQRDTVIEVSVAGDATACSSLWIFEPSSGMETSPPKQNTVTVSALAKALGLLAHAWERKGQVRTCSVHSFAAWAPRQPPNSTASVKCVCVCVGFVSSAAIDLLYWRDIKQTGIVFGSFLLLLFSLTQFSVVSVVAYLALAALSATISFRIYKSVLQAVQKTDEGHPFKWVSQLDQPLPSPSWTSCPLTLLQPLGIWVMHLREQTDLAESLECPDF